MDDHQQDKHLCEHCHKAEGSEHEQWCRESFRELIGDASEWVAVLQMEALQRIALRVEAVTARDGFRAAAHVQIEADIDIHAPIAIETDLPLPVILESDTDS